MKDRREIVGRLPLISLLGANAIPLVGVLFFKWDAFGIVLLYWSENVVVGFYNVLKIALVKVKEPVEHLGKLFMMHIAIIAGGFALVALKSPVGLLLVLVVLKTFVDVKLHFYEHRKKGAVKVR